MEALLAHCQAIITEQGGVLLTLLVAGLVGGFTHCAGMCGPFVMAQSVGQGNGGAILRRMSGKALIPYHLGRMTTYVVLGVIAALLSKQIMGTPVQKWVSASLLLCAGIVFLANALPVVKGFFSWFRIEKVSYVGQGISKLVAPLFLYPRGIKGYMIGVMLGFLPCGLVFAALMVVSTTANIGVAALAMVFFTLGTIPSLVMISMASQHAYRRWPMKLQSVARMAMAVNGVLLCTMAGKIAITGSV